MIATSSVPVLDSTSFGYCMVDTNEWLCNLGGVFYQKDRHMLMNNLFGCGVLTCWTNLKRPFDGILHVEEIVVFPWRDIARIDSSFASICPPAANAMN